MGGRTEGGGGRKDGCGRMGGKEGREGRRGREGIEEGLGERKEKGMGGGERTCLPPSYPVVFFFMFSERNGTVKSSGLIVTEPYNVVSRDCKSSFLTAN